MMKTTERFERAVILLYSAYHNGELYGSKCTHCAVGTLCKGNSRWADVVYLHPLPTNNFNPHYFTEGFNKMNERKFIKQTGYSIEELLSVEKAFLIAAKEGISETKESQFKGLCAVVEYLAELDGIPNPMDYSALFETENDKPKYELQSVFK